MSYTIYTTKAIVLAAADRGEANRTVTLLTADLGLIRATVQSVREVKSKHRYGLQLFSYSDVSLVLGKGGWRVTGVMPIESYGLELSQVQQLYAVYVRAASLVKRLVAGEESNPLLFREMHDALRFLVVETIDEEELQFFETLLILRVLNHLGYWSQDEAMPWMVDAVLSQEILIRSAEHHSNLIKKINASLRETQL
jgi:DNA repair protein RecO